ncbi:hypothetical protein FNL56_20265 [Tardiphaga sp. vice304]|uniref:hypothetical protein n=1 Tax=Tardiphaga sp. vice304 TaxID=2592817 RepID=UPI001165198C|nr:hypothetical protein FNL56_20265 [Tardiphaga sp. vice304]
MFAAIDAEPALAGAASPPISRRLAEFFAGLSPLTLMALAVVGALALLLQAGVIGSILMLATLPVYPFSSTSSRKCYRSLDKSAQGPA